MMGKNNQLIYLISGIAAFLLIGIWGLKYFNLSWVESTEQNSVVTINFFTPMKQKEFEEHIRILGKREDNNEFNYSVEWINNQVVEIKLYENSQIKGQEIQLLIQNAPTQLGKLTKSIRVNVQFKTHVEILSPTSEILISSTNPFIVQFNTPMNLGQMSKYLQCDTKFNITPYEETLSTGEKLIDDTKYLFTPEKSLDNGKKYVLVFKAGMASKGGTLLENDQIVMLKVDERPSIIKTYPMDGDKWIGLYPKITLQSKEPITGAMAKINNQLIKGELTDQYHACFMLDDLLKPEVDYQIDFQIQVASGETSEVKTVKFTTTTIKNNRFWLDIRCKKGPAIYCYQGNQIVKVIPCQISDLKNGIQKGTYYLEGKAEVYENNTQHVGANYWMMINETFGIHGLLRNSYWELLQANIKSKNIIISDEDAEWLYEKVNYQTMIVIRS